MKKSIMTLMLLITLAFSVFADSWWENEESTSSNKTQYSSSFVSQTSQVSNSGYYYIVTIEIAQSHSFLFSDLDDIVKDKMNKIKIEIPVDKDYYDNVYVGKVIDDSFRLGSFIMSGSVGNWKIKIVDKKTIRK